jgi:hypothetical protein
MKKVIYAEVVGFLTMCVNLIGLLVLTLTLLQLADLAIDQQ